MKLLFVKKELTEILIELTELEELLMDNGHWLQPDTTRWACIGRLWEIRRTLERKIIEAWKYED